METLGTPGTTGLDLGHLGTGISGQGNLCRDRFHLSRSHLGEDHLGHTDTDMLTLRVQYCLGYDFFLCIGMPLMFLH